MSADKYIEASEHTVSALTPSFLVHTCFLLRNLITIVLSLALPLPSPPLVESHQSSPRCLLEKSLGYLTSPLP